jgi:hypothetical protein
MDTFYLIIPYVVEYLDLCNIGKICYLLCKNVDNFEKYVHNIYYPLYYNFGIKYHPIKEQIDEFAKELVSCTVLVIKNNSKQHIIEPEIFINDEENEGGEIYVPLYKDKEQKFIEFSPPAQKIRYELCKCIPLMPNKKEYYSYHIDDHNEAIFNYPYYSPQSINNLLNIRVDVVDSNLEISIKITPLYYLLLNLAPSLANRLLSDNIVIYKQECPYSVLSMIDINPIQYGVYEFFGKLIRLNEVNTYSDSEFELIFDELQIKNVPLELIWKSFTKLANIAEELPYW